MRTTGKHTRREKGVVWAARLGATAAGALCGALLCSAAGAADLPRAPSPIPPGSLYVAMGSSFASGPGVTRSADTPPTRCQRSADNYAHQLARKRNVRLVDVSCGGATTSNLLGPWGELPPQLDALAPDTRLVTITIGGNDVNYIGGLLMASCETAQVAEPPPLCRYLLGAASHAGGALLSAPTEAAWTKLEGDLERVVQEVRRRAPAARLIFVDYFTVLPQGGLCALTPLPPEAAARARETAARLARLTAEVAARTGVEDLRISQLSRDHDACAKTPWVTGFVPRQGAKSFMPYHPNLQGMTEVADMLNGMLGR